MTENERKLHSNTIKPKWKPHIEGVVSQWFGENANPMYAKMGMLGHNGIDTNVGWLSPVHSHMDGYVWKTYDEDLGTEGSSGYTAVFTLHHIKNDLYLETKVGHVKNIHVKEKEFVPENYVIAHEGNTGTVYSGRKKYTKNSPDKGSKGDHRHWQYRPVRRVPNNVTGKHYLRWLDGRMYQDGSGYVYEIINDNGYQGCIDPMNYRYKNTFAEDLAMVTKNVAYVSKKFAGGFKG